MKKYTGLLWLLGFLVLMFVLLRRPAVISGTELGYRLPAGAPQNVEDVVRARVDALALQAEIERKEDLLLIRIPDATAEEVADVKRLLHRRGKLEFRPAAEHAAQLKWKADGLVPEGFEAIDSNDPEYSPKMLVEKTSLLEGGRIVHASKGEVHGGERKEAEGFVTLKLDAVAEKAFDAAAARLHARRPPGLIAILLDGRLHAAPAVTREDFEGAASIHGLGLREAKELAIVLASGMLAVPLDGPPEFERPYQKTR